MGGDMGDTLTRGSNDDDPATWAAINAFADLRDQHELVTSAVARAHGIGARDLRAIVVIESNDDVTPKRLADVLRLTTGSVTTLLDRVERAGFVRRAAHPRDRRSVRLELTASGADMIEGLRRMYSAAFSEALGGTEAARLANDLTAISNRLREILTVAAADLEAQPTSIA
jgi:DNA-binding MarR family transcriptional regulator